MCYMAVRYTDLLKLLEQKPGTSPHSGNLIQDIPVHDNPNILRCILGLWLYFPPQCYTVTLIAGLDLTFIGSVTGLRLAYYMGYYL